jgi:hypothetical protein
MAYRAYERSIPEIITDLLCQFPTLVRKEAQLARAELSEKITQVGLGLALIAGGAILLIPALVILLEAAVAALERAGLQPPIAALIAGGAALVIGIILLLVGISRLKAENMVPQKTINQIQQDASMAKRQVRSDDDYQRAA